jgi:hypothetical protein
MNIKQTGYLHESQSLYTELRPTFFIFVRLRFVLFVESLYMFYHFLFCLISHGQGRTARCQVRPRLERRVLGLDAGRVDPRVGSAFLSVPAGRVGSFEFFFIQLLRNLIIFQGKKVGNVSLMTYVNLMTYVLTVFNKCRISILFYITAILKILAGRIGWRFL